MTLEILECSEPWVVGGCEEKVKWRKQFQFFAFCNATGNNIIFIVNNLCKSVSHSLGGAT